MRLVILFFATSLFANDPEWKQIHVPLLDAIKSGSEAIGAVATKYKTRIVVYTNTQGHFEETTRTEPEGIKRLVLLIMCSTGGISWSFIE